MKKHIPAAISALILATPVFGAAITEVNTKKKFADVELEEGETFEKGAAVCFFGEDGEKGECGTISRIKDSVARVKVKKPKKLKVGMTMKLDEPLAADGEASGSASGSGSGSGSGSEEGEKTSKKAAKKKAASKKSPLRLVGYAGLPVRTPSTFNKIAYAYPETTTPSTLWSKDSAVASAAVQLAGEVAIPVGKFAVVPGVRYRLFTPSSIDSDYEKGMLNPYITTEQKASSFGFYTDFQYLRFNPASFLAVNLLAGIDIDMTTVTLTATSKDERPTGVTAEAASATSKLSVASLRLGANTDIMMIKILGARVGFGVMLPLAAFGAKFSGKVTNTHGLSDDAAATADLKKSIDHKKAKYAAEIDIGGELSF